MLLLAARFVVTGPGITPTQVTPTVAWPPAPG
jgi:hypothetical protein